MLYICYIAQVIMLIRIVIITNYKRSHIFLRLIIIFFTSFILSLSFELVSLNSGIFGKALSSKIKNFTLEYTSENIYSYIFYIEGIYGNNYLNGNLKDPLEELNYSSQNTIHYH